MTVWKDAKGNGCGLQYSDGLRAGWPGFDSRQGQTFIFLYSIPSIPALGPTRPPIQWVPGLFLRGESGREVQLTAHLHLMSRSIMRGQL
jgi:hypothetical protein